MTLELLRAQPVKGPGHWITVHGGHHIFIGGPMPGTPITAGQQTLAAAGHAVPPTPNLSKIPVAAPWNVSSASTKPPP